MLRYTLTFLLVSLALGAQSADKLDALFAPLAAGKTPGLAVMVRQNGKTVAQRASSCGEGPSGMARSHRRARS